MHVRFVASPRRTVGVEWELGLVDPDTTDLVSVADQVLDQLPDRLTTTHSATGPDDQPRSRVTKEFLLNTVELVTGVCLNAGEVAHELQDLLVCVRAGADAVGVGLFGGGSHAFAQWQDQTVASGERYDRLLRRTQWWGRQMLIFGVHVHVGVTADSRVWPLVSAMLSYQPHLLALSASSPFWSGVDTGYASNRTMMFQQLPTAGIPEMFTSWADFESYVNDARTVGLIDGVHELRWDLRPSPRFGTLETRVCDGVATLAEVSALAAVTHCLAIHLDDALDAGAPPCTLAPWQIRENKWRAARYGLDAVVIRDASNRETPLREDLLRLLDVVSPVARRLGCMNELSLVERIVHGGAGYERQRAVALATHGDLHAVMRAVASELVSGPRWMDRNV